MNKYWRSLILNALALVIIGSLSMYELIHFSAICDTGWLWGGFGLYKLVKL